jgi:hypothetical protein
MTRIFASSGECGLDAKIFRKIDELRIKLAAHIYERTSVRNSSARAKIKPAATFHILRHTYASALAMRGVPMGVIGEVFKALKASKETDKQYVIAGWRCGCEHLADPGNADGIDLCQSGPVRVSEAIKEVYYEHRKESCSHHRRVARYRCGPRQGIS